MNDDIDGTEGQSGLSRRDVIKRGAIVGGALVWTTPVVQSLAGPAFAQEGSRTIDEDCDEIIQFKYEVDEDRFISGTVPDCRPAGYVDDGDFVADGPGNVATIPGHGSITVTISGDGKSATITVPEGCTLLNGQAKAGSTQGGTLTCGTATPSGTEGEYEVEISREISFVAGVVCC